MICATCAVVCASPQHVVSMIGRIALRYSAESSGSCVLCSRYFSSSAFVSRYWCSMYSSYDSSVPNVRSSSSGTTFGMTVTGFMNDIAASIADAHEFGFGEEVERPAAAFAAEAAHPDAAERLPQVAQEVAVDPAHPGAHVLREAHPGCDVRRPDVRREAEPRRVGARDDFVERVEPEDGEHGAEHLFGGDRLRLVARREDRRCEIVAAG